MSMWIALDLEDLSNVGLKIYSFHGQNSIAFKDTYSLESVVRDSIFMYHNVLMLSFNKRF